MHFRIVLGLLLEIYISTVLLVCGGSTPDLLPVETKAAYCDTNSQRTVLTATVRNQGGADAPATKTTVEFHPKQGFPGQTITLDTPPIAKNGGTAQVMFSIPTGCFEPDCGFTITVESANQVSVWIPGQGDGDSEMIVMGIPK